MKSQIIISISTLYLLLSCNHQVEINVLFEKNKMVAYSMKKLDTIHTHKCETKKLTDVENQITFKLCNEFFISNKSTNIANRANKDLIKNNLISLKDFLENYSHLRGVKADYKIFFIEKNKDSTYQKYHVIWSKDFIDYEPSQKLYQ